MAVLNRRGPLSISQRKVITHLLELDKAGNVEAQYTAKVQIDKTAPTLTVTANGAPLANGMEFQDSQLITLALQATDNLSGVAEQTIIMDGKPYVVGTVLDWAGQLGTHVVQITVNDVAGNVSQSVINVTSKQVSLRWSSLLNVIPLPVT